MGVYHVGFIKLFNKKGQAVTTNYIKVLIGPPKHPKQSNYQAIYEFHKFYKMFTMEQI